MASANGYKLTYTHEGEERELVASWAAPYFVLWGEPGEKPGLYHAETLADAEAFARHGGAILDANFAPVDPRDAKRVNL